MMGGFRDGPVIARAAPFLLFIALLMLGSVLPFSVSVFGAELGKSWFVAVRVAIVALARLGFCRGVGGMRRAAQAGAAGRVLASV